MRIFDLHCDTIMRFYEGKHLRDMENTHINLEKLKTGQCYAQCFAIYVPSHESAARHGITDTPEEYFDKAYARYIEELELNQDELLPAYCMEDVEKNWEQGKVSSILTVEDGVTINGNLETIDEYSRRGIRMVSLTWNHENSLGYPQSPDPQLHSRGLKAFGIEAVRRMNEVGIAVDVSHLSEGGFWDVVKHTSKPFIASHSCARAVCDHSRNLTDDQLRAVADKGGVVGINYLSGFLHEAVGGAQDRYTSIEDIARHLLHMANVAGIDTLALGSDYDGMHSTMEWKDCGGNQLLVDGLSRYFSDGDLEKICWKNAVRVFRDVIGK